MLDASCLSYAFFCEQSVKNNTIHLLSAKNTSEEMFKSNPKQI